MPCPPDIGHYLVKNDGVYVAKAGTARMICIRCKEGKG